MNINISVSGAEDILQGVHDKLSSAIECGAQIAADAARNMCPVDTGTLKSSINVTGSDMSARINADTDYAGYVEFGTSKTAPQPYLVPALINSAGAITEEIARALSE